MADWTTDPFYLAMLAQIKPKPKPKPRPKSKAGVAAAAAAAAGGSVETVPMSAVEEVSTSSAGSRCILQNPVWFYFYFYSFYFYFNIG